MCRVKDLHIIEHFPSVAISVCLIADGDLLEPLKEREVDLYHLGLQWQAMQIELYVIVLGWGMGPKLLHTWLFIGLPIALLSQRFNLASGETPQSAIIWLICLFPQDLYTFVFLPNKKGLLGGG